MSEHPPLKQLHEYACGSLEENRRKELSLHIDGCFECAEEVEASQALDSIAHAGLRALGREIPAESCLSSDMLADYFDGSLSAERLAAAERHLSVCASCRENLVEIHAVMEKRQRGELTALDKETGERVLNLLPSPEPAALICMRCRQPNRSGSRICASCGAVLAPPRKRLFFAFAGRRGVFDLLRTHVWLLLGLGAMAVSLVLERYFIQSVTIALILIAKWILDRTQLSFYRRLLKSLRSDAEPEQESARNRRKAL